MNIDNIKSLNDILSAYSEQKSMKKPLLEAKIINYWSEMMGTAVNKYTEKIYIINSTLFIKVGPAALKNELVYLSDTIIQRINAYIEQTYITKIVIL
jgi:hypothetical protein